MLDAALNIGDASAGVALVPGAVEHFRGDPELHDEVAGQVLRLDLAALLARRIRAASSLPMMMRASEPPTKARRLSYGFVHTADFMLPPIQKMASA
jgi:hypothetical protein